MGKGEQTKQQILGHAFELARSMGLDGVSIGRLAQDLNLSKSGLFAHFQSKERLQMQVLETAGERFSEQVVIPAMQASRGPDRMWAIFDHWLKWGAAATGKGGCIFLAATIELDDQPGPVRDTLVALMQKWIEVLEKTVELGQKAGLFREDIDRGEVVQNFYGIMVSCHLYYRLFHDKNAVANARASAKQLIDSITLKRSK